IQRRSYIANYMKRVQTFRSIAYHAPICRLSDGTLCPEMTECHLGTWMEEWLYVGCKNINICTFHAWEGPNCTKHDNSDEVCQQNEEEIIETIAAAGGWTRDEAAQKLAEMWELDGKENGWDEACPDRNKTMPAVTEPAGGAED